MPHALARAKFLRRREFHGMLPAARQIFPGKFVIFKKLFIRAANKERRDSGTYFRILSTLRAKGREGGESTTAAAAAIRGSSSFSRAPPSYTYIRAESENFWRKARTMRPLLCQSARWWRKKKRKKFAVLTPEVLTCGPNGYFVQSSFSSVVVSKRTTAIRRKT